jgi:hypothetical protein
MNGLPGNLQPRTVFDATVIAIIESQGARAILLTKGKIAIVDAEDHERLARYSWYAIYHKSSDMYYAARNDRSIGEKICVLMHREILGLGKDDKRLGDHIDRNSLNNRRLNLRAASKSLNSYNCKEYSNNTSRYRGVVWDGQRGLWLSKITVLGCTKNLGRFSDPIEAAMAFDRAATLYRGNTATLNFPHDGDRWRKPEE